MIVVEAVIAIDGPAGAGKSTIAKIIARRLNYIYIDTGAMYRALTLKALNQGLNLDDEDMLARLAYDTEIRLKVEDRVLLDGIDVTEEIRSNKVSNNVSLVAKVKKVREVMVTLQQDMAKEGGVVMDGRDIGTVVLPNADYKFFLTASVKERARRRYQDLCQAGEEVDLHQIEQEISRRDEMDKDREISPLKQAEDAIEVDSTCLSIDEVVKEILTICQEG